MRINTVKDESMKHGSLSKMERREMRRLSDLAYDRELSGAAADLLAGFEEWRAGRLDVFQLNERIHRYHDGRSRDLYKTYALGDARWNVASAIVRGVLREPEASPELLENLHGVIGLVRSRNSEEETELTENGTGPIRGVECGGGPRQS